MGGSLRRGFSQRWYTQGVQQVVHTQVVHTQVVQQEVHTRVVYSLGERYTQGGI